MLQLIKKASSLGGTGESYLTKHSAHHPVFSPCGNNWDSVNQNSVFGFDSLPAFRRLNSRDLTETTVFERVSEKIIGS